MSERYIEFRDVNKSFGEQDVLRDVNFHMNKGETAVILGRSGVGKSVSLKLIMGFLKADSGRVIVAEQDITDFTEKELMPIRRRVTMVFQAGALFDSLTVEQNVAFPMQALANVTPDAIDERVAELLEMLEVRQFADKLPSELSTGTKRAVAIARALAQDPEAILYDEPTTMVDPLAASHTGDLILKLKEKFHKTSVVVTHDTHLARRLADSIIFLHQGQVTFFGTWPDFEKSEDPFIRNFRIQDELIPALDVIGTSEI
ncbi:MAG: ATP-binding cassette domain-containing protein [Candidatus Acidiferrales bacterium]